MSDVRFLEALGAEFKRVAEETSRSSHGRRRDPRWLGVRQRAAGVVLVSLSLLVVVGVAAVVLSAHGRRPPVSGAKGGGVRVVFTASALGPRAARGPALDRSVEVLRLRLESVFPGVQVSRAGTKIVVRSAPPDSRARIVALAAPAILKFYDWEANVLLPDGRTVASLGPSIVRNARARTISQGAGVPGAGSMSLYEAVLLASNQPVQFSPDNSRQGSQYYMFGAPGSSACAIAGKYLGYTPRPGEHCLLSGPDPSLQALYRGLPRGIGRSQGRVLAFPQGTVVLEAVPSHFSNPPKISNPAAQFYVLKDRVALDGDQITNPRQSTDPSGAPDVTLRFTARGRAEFQKLTGQVARRGQMLSGLNQTLDQHFAIAVDQRLTTVPQIDFKQYPNGVIGVSGADITGGFTTQSAQTLAILLRFGPLPVTLVAH